MIGSGFGPSSGRLVTVTESTEARIVHKRSAPPPLFALVFTVVWLGGLSGLVLLHQGRSMLGSIVLSLTASVVAVSVIWVYYGRR